MQIIFDLPHVFNYNSDEVENALALKNLLDCLVNLNISYLRTNPGTVPLYNAGVRYGRTLWWDTIPALYKRGYGDCKSLSAALVAQYKMQGKVARPVFRWVKNADGSTDYHILVETANGGYEDPSKVLGMGKNENSRFFPSST